MLFLIVAIWFACGFLNLFILRRENLPPIYKILLVLEGFVGLIFILIFKGGK